MALDFPPQEFFLKPWLATGSIDMIHAQRGHSKTLLAFSIGHAVATGQSLMRWECEKPARVLYVDGELPAHLLKTRLELLGPLSPNFLVLSDSMFRQQGRGHAQDR